MSTEFKREERYLVFKLSDVEEHFTPDEKQQLARLAEIQRVGRSESGKPLLECVVVEVDWPEYGPTWNAIEARVTGAQSVKDAIIDDLQSQFDTEGITEHDSGDALIRLSDAIAAVEDNFALAQPALSVPDEWQLVPSAESRHPGIYKMLGALHVADNTPGVSEWESYQAMLAEAPKPETKP